MGKGSRPRPRGITREEEDLRNDFAFRGISLVEFNRRYAELKQKGLIRRSGRILE